jgi:biopolymer transport protein ExbB
MGLLPLPVKNRMTGRAFVLLLAVAGAGFFAVSAGSRVSWAQNDDEIVADDDGDVIADEDAAAAPAPAASQNAPPAPRRRSYLAWLYESLGLLYSVIFLGLSFSLVAVFVMNLLVARRDQILPAGLIEGFEKHLEAKQYQEAYELARNDDSFLGKVLSAGLSRLTYGYQPAVEAMQEVGEEESMRLEHLLSYLALIGTISPMFGLLGTVDGMVQAFDVIAQSTVSPKPNELAQGIATALVTTLVGLWLAIPAIAAFNILRNRVSRLVLEVGTVSEGLMRRFQNVGPKKA